MINFLTFTFKILVFLHLTLLKNLSELDAIKPTMIKLNAILKSECANTEEFLLLVKRELKGITILP